MQGGSDPNCLKFRERSSSSAGENENEIENDWARRHGNARREGHIRGGFSDKMCVQ